MLVVSSSVDINIRYEGSVFSDMIVLWYMLREVVGHFSVPCKEVVTCMTSLLSLT